MLASKSTPAPKNKKKEKFFVRVKNFLKSVWAELKKVHWPTRKQIIQYTGIVLATIAVLGLAVWIADTIFAALMGLVL